MAFNLNQFLKKSYDQANVFDGGKTWKNPQGSVRPAPPASTTARRGTNVQPALTVRQANTPRLNQNAPVQQRRVGPVQVAQPRPLNVAKTAVMPNAGARTGVKGMAVPRAPRWAELAQVPAMSGARVGVGLLQAGSGAYDLATKGTGTNRFSDRLKTTAENLDYRAKDLGVTGQYKAGNVVGELATIASGVGIGKQVALQAAKVAPKTAAVVSRANQGAINAVNRATTGLVNGNKAQKVVGEAARFGLKPSNIAVENAFSGYQLSKEASQGQDISPQRVATELAINTVGIPAAVGVGKAVVVPAAKATTRLVQNAPQATRDIVAGKPNRNITDEELRGVTSVRQAMTGFKSNMDVTEADTAALRSVQQKLGTTDPKALDDLIGSRRQFDVQQSLKQPRFTPLNEGGYVRVKGDSSKTKKLLTELDAVAKEIDKHSAGSPKWNAATKRADALATKIEKSEFDDAKALNAKSNKGMDERGSAGVGAIAQDVKAGVNKIRQSLTPLNEGGYAKNPFGNKAAVNASGNVTKGLNKQQTEFINEYANMLEDMGSGNGVEITAAGTRVSNNARTADTAGRNMSKADWFEQARKELESGNGAYGASDEYKTIPTGKQPKQPAQQPVPAQSQKSVDSLADNSTVNTDTAPTTKPTQSQSGAAVPALTPKQLEKASSANSTPVLGTPLKKQATSDEIGAALGMSKQDVLDAGNPKFEAAARAATSKGAKKLGEDLMADERITNAARQAQLDGSEFNYFAKKDPNGRSVGIEQFDADAHRIEAGFVMDKKGNVLGNHVKVDETGVQVNVGGELVNMSEVVGDFGKLKNSYAVGETMDRNLERALGKNSAQYRKARDFLIGNKTKNERNFKTELRAAQQNLAGRVKTTLAAKPRNVSKDEYKADIFDYIENNKSQADIKAKYGNAEATITNYKNETRKLYDELLDRVNTEYVKYGEAPVPKRQDYITHINELNNNKGFGAEIYGSLKNSVLGETDGGTRGAVPGEIAGRTENFKPNKKWNPFQQQRNGGQFTKDPFKAVDEYLAPAFYNIHMTQSTVRARAMESAVRAAEKFQKEATAGNVKEELKTLFNADSANKNRVAKGLQEYANALAGKTNALDRSVIDMSDASATALKGWQGLQRIGGRATILGNAQSVLAQTLGTPSLIASAGTRNWLKSIPKLLTNDQALKQSDFVQARITHVDSPMRSKSAKAMDALGVPLREVEQQFVKMAWLSQHEAALAKGFKGRAAVQEADRLTERVVAGRGIADRPELYRSTTANGFLQYTLEVSAQNKLFWKDLNAKQKATFVVAAFAMNDVMGRVTGFEALPDFLGAGIDSVDEFNDENDTRNTLQKGLSTTQRFAGQVADMNPIVAAGANVLDQEVRKTLFGEESNLGRFDGQAAPVRVIKNVYDAGKSASEGKLAQARDSALRGVAPAGNQIRKTWSGAEMNSRGYATDKAGNPTYAAPSGKLAQGKALVFGPASTKEARDFYANNQTKITGKKDVEQIKNSTNKRETVEQIQKRRLETKQLGTLTTDQKEQYDALPKDQRKPFLDRVARSNQKAGVKGEAKPDNKTATSSTTPRKSNVKVSDKITPHSKEVLDQYYKLDAATRKSKEDKEPDYEWKVAKSKLENDKASGKLTGPDLAERELKVKKLEIGKSYDKEARELFGKKKQLVYDYVTNAPNGQKLADQLVAYEARLYEAGLIDYMTFQKSIAPLRGKGSKTASGRSRSSGGSRRTGKGSRGGRVSSGSGGRRTGAGSRGGKTGTSGTFDFGAALTSTNRLATSNQSALRSLVTKNRIKAKSRSK